MSNDSELDNHKKPLEGIRSLSHFNAMKSFALRQKILLAFSVPLFIFIVVAISVHSSTQSMVETSQWVEHTHKVIAQGHLLEKYILEMETGERGFLITGKDSFLTPFLSARTNWEEQYHFTTNLVADNPAQVARLDEINKLAEQWLNQAARPEIEERRRVRTGTISLDHIETLLESRIDKNIQEEIKAIGYDLTRKLERSHDQRASRVLIALLRDIVEQETGQLGFLITGEETFLSPFYNGKKNAKRNINKLRSIVLNFPEKDEVVSLVSQIVAATTQWNEAGSVYSFSSRESDNYLNEVGKKFNKLDEIYKRAGNDSARTFLFKAKNNFLQFVTERQFESVTGRDSEQHVAINYSDLFNGNMDDILSIAKSTLDKSEVSLVVDDIESKLLQWQEKVAHIEIKARRKINKTGLSPVENINRTYESFLDPNYSMPIERELQRIRENISQVNVDDEGLLSDIDGNLKRLQVYFMKYMVSGSETDRLIIDESRQRVNYAMFGLAEYLHDAVAAIDRIAIMVSLSELRMHLDRWYRERIDPSLYAKENSERSRESTLSHIKQVLNLGAGKMILEEVRDIISDVNEDFLRTGNDIGS